MLIVSDPLAKKRKEGAKTEKKRNRKRKSLSTSERHLEEFYDRVTNIDTISSVTVVTTREAHGELRSNKT